MSRLACSDTSKEIMVADAALSQPAVHQSKQAAVLQLLAVLLLIQAAVLQLLVA